MARAQSNKPTAPRRSGRYQAKSAAAGEKQRAQSIRARNAAATEKHRVRKYIKRVEQKQRRKRNKARGADALRRLQAGEVMSDSCLLSAEIYKAAHPTAPAVLAGAIAHPSTRDAATSTNDFTAFTGAIAHPSTRDAATSTNDLAAFTGTIGLSAPEVSPVSTAANEPYVPYIYDALEHATTPEERADILWSRKMFEVEKVALCIGIGGAAIYNVLFHAGYVKF